MRMICTVAQLTIATTWIQAMELSNMTQMRRCQRRRLACTRRAQVQQRREEGVQPIRQLSTSSSARLFSSPSHFTSSEDFTILLLFDYKCLSIEHKEYYQYQVQVNKVL